jgi:hypothetical protein
MYEQQEMVWETLDLWEPAEPSAGFDRALYQKIERSRATSFTDVWSWLRGLGDRLGEMRPSLAATVAALLLAAGVILTQPRRAVEDVSAQSSPQVETEYVEQMDQALDDIEMVADFEALVLEAQGQGKS